MLEMVLVFTLGLWLGAMGGALMVGVCATGRRGEDA